MTKIVNTGEFRDHMKQYLDKIMATKQPLILTRPQNQQIIMMPLSEYESMQATMELMNDPDEYKKLLEAKHQLDTNDTKTVTIDELKHLIRK